MDGIHKDSVIEMHRMTTVPLRLEKEYKMIAPEITESQDGWKHRLKMCWSGWREVRNQVFTWGNV